jgi:hypothetical protein
LEIVLICVIIALVGVSAYQMASSRGKSAVIENLKEGNRALRAELFDWQNKALAKSGMSRLGYEREPKPEPKQSLNVTPTVVHRGQTKEAQPSPSSPVDINATGVSYQRVSRKEVIEKAKEVIDATK